MPISPLYLPYISPISPLSPPHQGGGEPVLLEEVDAREHQLREEEGEQQPRLGFGLGLGLRLGLGLGLGSEKRVRSSRALIGPGSA